MKRIRDLLVLAAAGLLSFGPAAYAQKGEMIVDISAPPLSSMLTPREAADRYTQGTLHERRKDLRAAFVAYTEAGEAGNGHAQKKLGDFYSNGNIAVERDYEAALKWYEKAREQGIEIPKPLVYPGDPNQVIRLK
jgi:TPR repeat protein